LKADRQRSGVASIRPRERRPGARGAIEPLPRAGRVVVRPTGHYQSL